MGADSFFVIGKSHDICEDYATDGVFDDRIPYTIVCDGCSSSQHTDFGSRILSKAIEKNLMWLLTIQENIETTSNRFITQAQMFANMIDLDNGSLNATALLAYRTEDAYKAHVYGDGVVVFKHADGYDVYVVEFPSGAPGYMAYALDPIQFKNYCSMFGTSRRIHRTTFNNDFEEVESECTLAPFTDPLVPYNFSYARDDTEMVAVFSDGVQTFGKTESEKASKMKKAISVFDIIKMLIGFKNTNGEFVKRRFKRFMKDADRLEWENFDDLSLGVVI